MYKTAPVGKALIDRNRRYLKINQHFAELNCAHVDEHIGRTLADMSAQLFKALDRPMDDVFARGRELTDLEASLTTSMGETRDFLIDVYPYEDGGRVTAVGLILKDVTQMRALEKEMRRLMDELQHRVKNTLATVNSIINQTVATKTDHPELARTLKARVGALAATHDLLTVDDWKGAPLLQILWAELLPYGQPDRISLEGPEIDLPPKHALALTLTLHELATNAAKYGALSKSAGNLVVRWAVRMDAAGRELSLEWSEHLDQPLPSRRVNESFGMKLIKNAITHDLRGTCVHALCATGVTCKLTFPF